MGMLLGNLALSMIVGLPDNPTPGRELPYGEFEKRFNDASARSHTSWLQNKHIRVRQQQYDATGTVVESFDIEFQSDRDSFIARTTCTLGSAKNYIGHGRQRVTIFHEAIRHKITVDADGHAESADAEAPIPQPGLKPLEKPDDWHKMQVDHADTIAFGSVYFTDNFPKTLARNARDLELKMTIIESGDLIRVRLAATRVESFKSIEHVFKNDSRMPILRHVLAKTNSETHRVYAYSPGGLPKSIESYSFNYEPYNLAVHSKTEILAYEDASAPPETFSLRQFALPEFRDDSEAPPLLGWRQYKAIGIFLTVTAVLAFIIRSQSRPRRK